MSVSNKLISKINSITESAMTTAQEVISDESCVTILTSDKKAIIIGDNNGVNQNNINKANQLPNVSIKTNKEELIVRWQPSTGFSGTEETYVFDEGDWYHAGGRSIDFV